MVIWPLKNWLGAPLAVSCEVVPLGIGVVMIGGVEIDGGIFGGLTGEGGADEGDPRGAIGIFREIVAQGGVGLMEIAHHFVRAGKALCGVERAGGTCPGFEEDDAGVGRRSGEAFGEDFAVAEELRDVADVGGAEAVVLEDDPGPSFLERLVGGRQGQEIGQVFAAGNYGGGLDLFALGGGDFLDELGDAAVFFDARNGGAEGEAVAEKEDVVRLGG